jgi:hypothetical protein
MKDSRSIQSLLKSIKVSINRWWTFYQNLYLASKLKTVNLKSCVTIPSTSSGTQTVFRPVRRGSQHLSTQALHGIRKRETRGSFQDMNGKLTQNLVRVLVSNPLHNREMTSCSCPQSSNILICTINLRLGLIFQDKSGLHMTSADHPSRRSSLQPTTQSKCISRWLTTELISQI